jgi:hypothetical protein
MQENWQSQVWTSMPAILQKVDFAKKTCQAQPAIKAQVRDENGNVAWVQLPLLVDCPIQFPGGGGYDITFPLKQGDEGLVVFSARCIDAWWQNGGIQAQAELRMHDLSDGFFIPGISSVPNVQADAPISGAEFQARSKDGQRMLRISTSEVEAKTPTSSVKCSAGRVDINGALYINGAAYLAHGHSGVTTGGGNTGGVV